MSGIASITPVWQQVRPTDVSRYIDGMADTYDKQNQVIKDQIKVFDTALANAQQAKMNEVQEAINALSIDDYNSPTAKANIDDVIAKIGDGIGGFNANNVKSLNEYWDKRGDVLVDKAVAQFNLNDAERKDTAAREKELIDDVVGSFRTLGVLAEKAKTPEEAAQYRSQQQTLIEDLIKKGYNYYDDFQAAYDETGLAAFDRKKRKETAEDGYAKLKGADYARRVDALSTTQAGLDAQYKAGKIKEADYLAQSKVLDDERRSIDAVLTVDSRTAGYFTASMEEMTNKRLDTQEKRQAHEEAMKLSRARAFALEKGVSLQEARLSLDAQQQEFAQNQTVTQNTAKAVEGSIDDRVNAIMGALGKPWEGSRGEIKMLFNKEGKIDPSLALKDLQTRVKRVANAEANATNQVQGTFRDWWQGKEGLALAKQFNDKGDAAAMNNALEYINNNNSNINFTTQEKIAFMKAVASKELATYSTGNDKGWFDTGRGWLNNQFAHSAASNWLASYRTQEREKKRIANQKDIALYMEQTGVYIDGGWDSIIKANPKTFSDTNLQIYALGKAATSGSSTVKMSPNGAPQGHPAYHPSNNGGATKNTLPKTSAAGYVGSKVVTSPNALPVVGALVDGSNFVKGLFD